jgi:hypothetical protein
MHIIGSGQRVPALAPKRYLEQDFFRDCAFWTVERHSQPVEVAGRLYAKVPLTSSPVVGYRSSRG